MLLHNNNSSQRLVRLCLGASSVCIGAASAAAQPSDAWFAGCGTLITPGNDLCPRFQSDDGQVYALLTDAGFEVGTRVWVTGIVNPQSLLCAPQIMPGIEDNTIGLCFEACGTLVLLPGLCVGIQTDDGAEYALDNIGNFNIGDRVWVQGCLNQLFCFPCFVPCVTDNTIAPCIADCGLLQVGPLNSIQFHADSGGIYCLENVLPFVPGQRVWARGCLNTACTYCLGGDGCIEDNTIGLCFSGCGSVEPTPVPECNLLVSDNGQTYSIENIDGFGGTDVHVWVKGCLEPFGNTGCPSLSLPSIVDNSIGLCFDGCGYLVQGVECVLFQADVGGLYFVANHGSFQVGDHVRVTGCLDPTCATICLQGDGCIFDNTILSCLPADFDGDGDVDPSDYAHFQTCMGGPEFTPPAPPCDDASLDDDADVDLRDFAEFQVEYDP